MSLYRRVANLFTHAGLHEEIDAELRAHIEMRTDDNIAAGMTPEEARRAAMLRFGNPSLTNERVTAADIAPALDNLWRDLRYAARQLRRSPGFTVTAVLTLALAIAANVTVFGLLNALVLQPLHVAGSDRLFTVVHGSGHYDNESYPDFIDLRDRNATFSGMLAYRFGDVGLSASGSAQRCWHFEVSGNYFDMLGVKPALGRFFRVADEHGPNSVPYIVLSYSFWRARFNGDPNIIGKIVELNKHSFTIVGVAPANFHGTELLLWPDVFVPMVNEAQIEGYSFLDKRFNHGIWILGKLKPGVSTQAATENLRAVAAQLKKQYREDEDLQPLLVSPGLMGDNLGTAVRAFLIALMSLAFLVLAAACANLASIFGARAADRSRELAIRLAIGSSRGHIIRQLLTEALLLSLLGAAAGTLVAALVLQALTHWQPVPGLPVGAAVTPDGRVYGIAILLAAICGLLPGLLAGRQVLRTDPLQAMKSGATSSLSRRRFTVRDALLAVQIALCALLLTASLVALRGMQRSLAAPVGFQPEGVVLAETDLHMGGYSDDTSLPFQKRMIEAAQRLPGVVAAGTIDDTPLGSGGSSTAVYREGTTDFRPSNSVAGPKYYSISPGYLSAAETRLLTGRDFTWHDDAKAPNVALINATLARILFGNAPAVGRRFARGDKEVYTVVGVVENGKYDSLTEEPKAAMFLALSQNPDSDTALVVRSKLPSAEMAAALNRTLTKLDPRLPLTIQSWPQELALVLFPARAATGCLGIMGLLGAMLAVTGVFGMAAYAVSKRSKELGLRMALGARSAQMMRSALGRPLTLLIGGSLAGLLLGMLAARVLAQIVYEATPRDPMVLGGALLAMSLLGVIATWIPARRALAISPARLLKEE